MGPDLWSSLTLTHNALRSYSPEHAGWQGHSGVYINFGGASPLNRADAWGSWGGGGCGKEMDKTNDVTAKLIAHQAMIFLSLSFNSYPDRAHRTLGHDFPLFSRLPRSYPGRVSHSRQNLPYAGPWFCLFFHSYSRENLSYARPWFFLPSGYPKQLSFSRSTLS